MRSLLFNQEKARKTKLFRNKIGIRLVATMVAIGKNLPKQQKTFTNEKYRKTLVLSDFTVLFGGDKRDRTADLLNAMASGGGQNEYIWIK